MRTQTRAILKFGQAIVAVLLSTGFSASIAPSPSQAHGGGLDGSGGHNCYVAACAGEYHCHQPSWGCGVSYEEQPPVEIAPAPVFEPKDDWADSPQGFYFQGDYYSSLDQWFWSYEIPRLAEEEANALTSNSRIAASEEEQGEEETNSAAFGLVVLAMMGIGIIAFVINTRKMKS